MDEENYDLLLDETARVLKPDGSVLCVLLKKNMNPEWMKNAYEALKGLNLVTTARGIAAGERAQKRVLKSGRISNTTISKPVESGVIGYMDRSARTPYCRACAWNLKHPDKFAAVIPMIKEISSLFKEHVPDRYDVQKKIVDASSRDFVIPGTVYTTVTVNRNFRTAAHQDAGNLKEGFSAMSVVREGKWSGANLVFPDFRTAVSMDSGDLIFFDPQEFHGNTELIKLTRNAVRMSMVYYYREHIMHCKSAEEELKRVQDRKRGEPLRV